MEIMKDHARKGRLFLSQMAVTAFSFGLFLYFGFHFIHGDMGYFAMRGLNQKLAASDARLRELTAERLQTENRVKRLRPGSLDPDMLDERARAVLGFAAPDELIILEK